MWLTQDDLMQLGFKQRTIRHYIQSGRWESRDSGVRGRNGKELREVRLDSLSLAYQKEWAKQSRNPTAQIEIERASSAQSSAQIQRRAAGSEEFPKTPVNTNGVEFQAKSSGANVGASNGAPARNENPIQRANPTARLIETWLLKSEIAALGVNLGTLQNRIKAGTWKSRYGVSLGRNGKGIREILLESLPQDLQLRYWKAQREEISEFGEDDAIDRETPNDAPGEIDHERRLVESLKKYEPDVRDAFLVEAQRLVVIVESYDQINPKRNKNQSGKYEFVPTVLRLCEEAKCTDAAVLRIEPSRAKSRSPHTLDQWTKAYREIGLAAFLRKPSNAQNVNTDKRKAVVSAPAIEWVNSIWRNYPSPRHLYKALQKQAAKNGWVIPAESWIRRLYKGLPKIVSTQVFQGEKAYGGKYEPFVPRDYRDLEALQVLCGDHSVRDVMVMMPDGSLVRPSLTMWQCLRVGLIWGWHLDVTPSTNTIGLAYANGVQNFGAQPTPRPDGFKSYLQHDLGKDYRSFTAEGKTIELGKAFSIDGGLKALCTQRGIGFGHDIIIGDLPTRGYRGKQKFIERTHRDISDWEQNHFESEYCGRDAKNKPDAWVRAWHRHQKLLKKFPPAKASNREILKTESPFMTFDDYRENLASFINEYNHIEHTRSVLGGATIIPIDEYQRLYTTRYEISEEALALFLMRADSRKIGKIGVQMFGGKWFQHEAMSEFKGQTVEVRYSDGDYSRVWAVLPNGHIVESECINPGSILNPNKKSVETVRKMEAHERKMGREWAFIQQSKWRGETTEDRVAALINPEDDMPPERQKIAVNARPTVPIITRFDKKNYASPRPIVTTEQVERANVIEGIFRPEPEQKIKEEWED